MADFPRRPRHRHRRERIARVSASAIKHLPVTAKAPRIIPQPSLAPRSRAQAFAGALVLSATLLLLLGLISYSLTHSQVVGVLGKVFIITIVVLTMIAAALYIVALGLFVLPVLFGVRKPAPIPPSAWPGIGDRH